MQTETNISITVIILWHIFDRDLPHFITTCTHLTDSVFQFLGCLLILIS